MTNKKWRKRVDRILAREQSRLENRLLKAERRYLDTKDPRYQKIMLDAQSDLDELANYTKSVEVAKSAKACADKCKIVARDIRRLLAAESNFYENKLEYAAISSMSFKIYDILSRSGLCKSEGRRNGKQLERTYK